MMQLKRSIQEISFGQGLKKHKATLLIAAIVTAAQFIVFKLLYPFPNFLPDSYSYIEAADKQWHINLWPIGYSRFLWVLSFITRSHTGLVWLQYILLQASIMYLLYTVSYFLNPGKLLFRIMLIAAVCNPLTWQISNLVSADALFTSLSLVWFCQLLNILHNPTLRLILLHALVLMMVFTVRYNALYYPIISVSVLLLTKMALGKKLAGIAISCLLIGTFIGYTQYHYYKQTGWPQFAPFGSWQLASNALYAYSHVLAYERVQPGYERPELRDITDRHMDSVQNLLYRPDGQLGVYYLWDPQSPLQQNVKRIHVYDSTFTGLKSLSGLSYRYKDFGLWLIEKYPITFLQNYILPNLVNYYVPRSEFLGTYNMGQDKMDEIGTKWFRLNTNKLGSVYSPAIFRLNQCNSIVMGITNLLFVLGILGVTWLKLLSSDSIMTKRILSWSLIIWLSNILFSVLASPIVLRYQLFIMLITQTFMLWLLARVIQAARAAASQSITKTNQADEKGQFYHSSS